MRHIIHAFLVFGLIVANLSCALIAKPRSSPRPEVEAVSARGPALKSRYLKPTDSPKTFIIISEFYAPDGSLVKVPPLTLTIGKKVRYHDSDERHPSLPMAPMSMDVAYELELVWVKDEQGLLRSTAVLKTDKGEETVTTDTLVRVINK